ncbi:DHS-like NAD/FAD-binding domain-containing protein, partial [Thozetella sp. PMI_491]
LLRTRRNIILITGAGVSASTGIPTYQAASRSSRSSQVVYHPSAYSTEESAEMLHADILAKFETGLSASLTPFDRFIEYLAGTERIRRHFTQNIDCRHTRLPYLSKQTVWLHGRSDTLMCSKSSEHKFRVNPEGFRSMVMAACSLYQREQSARIAVGKRARGVGLLRPNILLYGEDCTNEEDLLDTMQKDLDHPVDAVLIVGTRLQIPSLRDFAVRLCERVSNKGGLVAWVN